MKTLGMIGGLGPESTLDYYQKIIALYRERTGDGSYPQFIINSIDLKRGLAFMDAGDLAGMAITCFKRSAHLCAQVRISA